MNEIGDGKTLLDVFGDLEATARPRVSALSQDLDALGIPLTVSKNPARVYLASISEGSRPTQERALVVIARLLANMPLEDARYLTADGRAARKSEDEALLDSTPWAALEYQHNAAVAARLAERFEAATANRMLAALRGVMRAAWQMGLISEDARARATDRLKVKGDADASQSLAGRHIPSSELNALLDTCGNCVTDIRDAAIISLLYSWGLRRAELVALQMSDYSPSEGRLTVLGKGRKRRWIYPTNGTKKHLEDWLAIRGDAPGAIFTGTGNRQKGKALTTQAIYVMLQRRAKEAGIAENLSPHDFRRTFVGTLLDSGVDISIVSKMAGHSDVRTTAKYDRRPEEAKREAGTRIHVPYRKRSLIERNS